jgi:predicted dehydrogenase
MTRREFFNRTARGGTAAALSGLLPAAGYAQKRVSPNDKITLGFIGVGGMGSGHLGGFLGNPQVKVLAVCDVYETHRENARKRVGGDCKAYKDFRELLDRKDVDAVVVATPDHWHTLIATAACAAGLDVYCEKPLTLTIGEGRQLVNVVRRYGRVFQVGSQQRSEGNFRFACELVRSGKIGKLRTVRTGLPGGPTLGWEPSRPMPSGLDWNLYLGPAPAVPFHHRRFGFDFRWFWDYSGGMMTDWGAHHNDIAQWGMGTELTGPKTIEGKGVAPSDGLYETFTSFEVTYTYANGVKLICSNAPHGAKFEGTNGWVWVDRGFLQTDPPDLLNETIRSDDVHLYQSPGHHQNWLDCMRSRQRPICDVEIGWRSVSVCHLGNIAMRLGRKLQWDPDKEQFIGDEEANRWVNKPYRAPWSL